MCGLFGWVPDGAAEANERLLELAVVGAADRGPHAHGWAIPGLPTHRKLGPVRPAEVPRTGTRLLGHARLATFGGFADLAAVQPTEKDGHRIAHNGNAPGFYAEHPHLPSDTVAVTMVYAEHRLAGNSPFAALTLVTRRLRNEGAAWALAVLDSDGSVVVSRRRLPLHVLRTQVSGLYLSSGGDLPGATPVPEDCTVQLAGAQTAAKEGALP